MKLVYGSGPKGWTLYTCSEVGWFEGLISRAVYAMLHL